MNVTIPRAALAAALKTAAAVADRKGTLPLLSHAVIRATDRGVEIAATDLNTATLATLEPKATAATGAVAVEARSLAQMVALLTVDDVTIRAIDEKAVEVKAGRSVAKFPALPVRDFPKFPSLDGLRWEPVEASAVEAIGSVAAAACADETRFHLCGVFVDGGKLIATDGHRLHLEACDFGTPTGAAIIPAKAVGELRRVLDAKGATVAWSATHLFARNATTTIAVKLIDAQFPPWRQVVPSEAKSKAHRDVKVPRALLLDALRRADQMCSATHGARLTFAPGEEEIAIASDNPDRGSHAEQVECGAWGGDRVTVGVNASYLIAALTACATDAVTLRIGGELDPIEVIGGEFRAVVMPMRVS